MKAGTEFREIVRVVMHLNGGFTRVSFERTESHHFGMPTEHIPLGLRAIGSRFVVRFRAVRPEAQDSADEIRFAVNDFVVETLPD